MINLMDLKDSKLMKRTLLLVGVSFVLFRLPIGNILFTIPLLVLESHFSDRREALLPVGLLALLIAVTELVSSRSALLSAEGRILLIISLFLPTVLLVGAAVWIRLGSLPTFFRYLASCAFGVVASLAIVLWFSRPSAAMLQVDAYFSDAFAGLLGQSGDNPVAEAALKRLYRTAVMSTGALLAPMSMVLIGFSTFLALSYRQRFEGDFGLRVSRWSVPAELLWPFLGSWTVVLLLIISKASYPLFAFGMQIALCLGVLYAVQGVAIVVHLLYRRGVAVRIGRLVTLLFIVSFLVPGLNVLVIFALPLLGVTENWIVYRRNE